MKTEDVVTTLRKDANYVWQAMIAVVFVGFAGVAIAAAVIDLMAISG